MTNDLILSLRDKMVLLADASAEFAKAMDQYKNTLTGTDARSLAAKAQALGAAAIKYAIAFEAIPAESMPAVMDRLKLAQTGTQH